MLRGDSGNHFQLYLYRNQDEVTHIPPPRPTGWAVHCEALPMRWWERVLAFFRLRRRLYKTKLIPGNDGWSLVPVPRTNVTYITTGMVQPKSGTVTPLWDPPPPPPVKVT